MSQSEKLEQILKLNFPKTAHHIQIENRPTYKITDYEEVSRILDIDNILEANNQSIKVSDDYCFQIENAKTTYFASIGKDGLLGKIDSHCDCILFDNNDFCFIELKLNATSDKRRAIHKNRQDAFDQLTNTIQKFNEVLNQNYEGLNKEAYICTPKFYPRANTAWDVLSVKFVKQNGVPLFETNSKICK